MNISTTRLSNTQKIVILCSLVFFLAALVFQLFFQKVRQAELYDELGARLSTIRFSIAKLEYELDIFIVSRQFESTSIDLIKKDVDSLNQSIEEIPGNYNYKTLLGGNALLYDGLNSITEDWHNINIEIARLDDALNADEVMLIHNTVDIHTVLVGEKDGQAPRNAFRGQTGGFQRHPEPDCQEHPGLRAPHPLDKHPVLQEDNLSAWPGVNGRPLFR